MPCTSYPCSSLMGSIIPREKKSVAQGCTASQCRNQNENPRSFTPNWLLLLVYDYNSYRFVECFPSAKHCSYIISFHAQTVLSGLCNYPHFTDGQAESQRKKSNMVKAMESLHVQGRHPQAVPTQLLYCFTFSGVLEPTNLGVSVVIHCFKPLVIVKHQWPEIGHGGVYNTEFSTHYKPPLFPF